MAAQLLHYLEEQYCYFRREIFSLFMEQGRNCWKGRDIRVQDESYWYTVSL